MTFRDEHDALRAHVADQERELAEAIEERDRLAAALSDDARLSADLAMAIEERRGSGMSGRGYLRVAGLIVVVFAFGAAFEVARPHGPLAWAIPLGGLALLLVSLVRADRERAAAVKLLDEHDARERERDAARAERGEPADSK